MKHIRNITLAILISVFSSSLALAEYTVGISGALANIGASGTEIEGGERNSKSIEHQTIIGSIFVEANDVAGSGVTLGIDYIPIAADVSDNVKKRTDTESSVTGTATSTTTTRNQSAQAELKDHLTFYAMMDMTSNLYFKLGYVHVDLQTLENLPTGSKYDNENVSGLLLGLGTEYDLGNGIARLEFSHTNYEDIDLKSTVARTGVSPNNLIEAQLDVTQIKASYGYKF